MSGGHLSDPATTAVEKGLTIRSGNATRPNAVHELRMGVVGVGVGATEILPAIVGMEGFTLGAAADVDPISRARFAAAYPEARVYEDAAQLCRDPSIDAVWIASPNHLHATHSILAANHGKDVIVEKPMATTLDDAEAMVIAAATNRVQLLVGHTISDPVPIQAMREIIASGRVGALRAIQIFSYSDWMLRPRTPVELDEDLGAGLVYRQGPRQIDHARVIAGEHALVRIRGMSGQWMPARPISGFYAAFLEFDGALPCLLLHNGYGYFSTEELTPWGVERAIGTTDDRVHARRQIVTGSRDDVRAKQQLRMAPANAAQAGHNWSPGDPGMIIVSCERGVLRHSERGLFIYDDDGCEDLPLDRPSMPHRAELDELRNALEKGTEVIHDGLWGLGTLEACLAIAQPPSDGSAVELRYRKALPPVGAGVGSAS